MPAFRFRAAVVLDLRAREERAASAAMSLAEARFREAGEAIASAEAGRQASREELAARQRTGTDAGTLLWHRNWIDRLARLVDVLHQERADRARQLQDAGRRWREARRRRLVIEKLRDRALARFTAEEHRREMQEMDELARIRHVMNHSEGANREC